MKKTLLILGVSVLVSVAAYAGDESHQSSDELKALTTKYDTNKDGKLDKEERAKMSAEDKAKMKELAPHKEKKEKKGE